MLQTIGIGAATEEKQISLNDKTVPSACQQMNRARGIVELNTAAATLSRRIWPPTAPRKGKGVLGLSKMPRRDFTTGNALAGHAQQRQNIGLS